MSHCYSCGNWSRQTAMGPKWTTHHMSSQRHRYIQTTIMIIHNNSLYIITLYACMYVWMDVCLSPKQALTAKQIGTATEPRKSAPNTAVARDHPHCLLLKASWRHRHLPFRHLKQDLASSVHHLFACPIWKTAWWLQLPEKYKSFALIIPCSA